MRTFLKIIAPSHSEIMQDVDRYFIKLWENKGAVYTHHYQTNEMLPALKYLTYRLQKFTHFTTY
ncbi:hypothetical protein [Bacillus sp. J33]|uniref:hypothetical protein n=1 Tax=Bacillus sp. J33 TaxID=935836 RepID=UPI00047EC857|nr:hypothetical protein [Bacillus sp. J33]